MMTYSGLIVISLLIIVVSSFLFHKQLARRTLMETLMFAFLFVITGGIFIAASSLSDFNLLVGNFLLLTGFFIGLFAFLLKKNT